MDLALNVMRTTPYTRLRNSAFELHFGREPNTEWSSMLNLDETKTITKDFISARLDTLQVHIFSGEGGSADHLPMKQKTKVAKTVSKYAFQFFERTKKEIGKFESPYSEHLQTAVTGTKHILTTWDNKIIHPKVISKPNNTFEQQPTNRGTGPRGPDGRFARKTNKAPATPETSQSEDLDTSPEPPTKKNKREQLAEEGHGWWETAMLTIN